MDGRGRATDNIFIERLWRTVKQDYVYICPTVDGTDLYKGLNKFFEYYNNVKTLRIVAAVSQNLKQTQNEHCN